VLLVEDEDSVAETLVQLLSLCGCDVEVASSGEAALEAFAFARYDVAVLDYMLGGMPGDQVAEEMRRRDRCLATILLTGYPIDKDDPRFASLDVTLMKPPELEDLEDAVWRAGVSHDDRVAWHGGEK